MSDTVTFLVPDMDCGGCEKKVRGALENALPGVVVNVDLSAKRVSVAGNAETAEEALREAGFNPEKAA